MPTIGMEEPEKVTVLLTTTLLSSLDPLCKALLSAGRDLARHAASVAYGVTSPCGYNQ